MAIKVETSIRAKIVAYYCENKDASVGQVANIFGFCKQTVSRFLKEAGIKIDAGRSIRGKPAPHLKGFKAWNKGLKKESDSRVAGFAKTKSQKQQVITADGYRKVWADDFKKSVKEHHLVWFQHYHYWPDFQKGEQIHHIDGDKLNNDITNLFLVKVDEHTELHKKYEIITYKLIKMGLVSLNRDSKELEADKLWNLLKKLNQ